MYSCGSLAPKMKKSSTGGGCGDCKFKKPSEPWEAADGCLWLMTEMSACQLNLVEDISKLLPHLAEALRQRHYTMHYHFLETMAKVLPILAQNLGKKHFKPHLELFFDSLFYAAENEDHPSANAASRECLRLLANWIGINILRGRVENYNPNYINTLNEILESPEILPNFSSASS